jgi:hypothetical protein
MPNKAPVADGGSDKTIVLPTNYVDLIGSATDVDGTISSAQWTQISGPTKTNFSTISPLAITARNLAMGVYTFRLTVTDNDGATVWDDVKVAVMPDPRTQSTAEVYPNPVITTLFIKIDALTLQNNSLIQIINSAGSVVYTENFTRTGFNYLKQVDVSKLPKGVYFLSISADINTTITRTFTKQ